MYIKSMYLHGVSEFDWDAHNTAHIGKHGVERWESESVLIDDPDRQDHLQERAGAEMRVLSRGLTSHGRPLIVVWTVRNGRVRVVAARQMTDAEYTEYRRW